MMVASHRVNICRLRVRGGERDSLSLQNYLAQLLAGADTHPGGLPVSAILFVRALRGPLPQMVWRRRRETRLPPVWEQMVRVTLDDLARRAARPAREAVPADAQAVVFADRAELLACSARDFCEGRIAGLWWWRSLFNGADLTASVRAAWRETPMYIPAALEVLAKQKKAVSFIRVLPMAETQDWLQALNHTFALRELHAVFSRLTPDSSTQRVDRRQSAAARAHQFAQHLAWSAQHLARPPWQRWVPEATDSELTSEQQCLLGIGLMLQRAPLVARSSSFAASVKLWINAEPIWPANRGDDALVIVPAAPGAVPTVVPQRESTAGARLSPLSLLPQEELLGGPPQPDSASGILSRATETQIRGSEPEQAATETFVAVPTPTAAAPDSAGASINPAHDEGPAPSTETAYSSELLSPKEADAATRRESREIETAFGGVFYLVNLGLFLGLYGEFTNPSRPGISLALWDFVALVGRELVGRELEDDPVWILLAELAGRDGGEEPGKRFTPPNQLETLSNALISHPLTHEGTGNALTVSQEEHEKSDSNNVPLRRWLDWLMPRLSARLRRALGLIAHDDLAALLCRHRARITVTATHVDVHLSLADLPITIRLAGLDRDPGWVPAAGRYIAFQFD